MGYTTLNKDEKEEEKKVLILFTPTFLPFGQEVSLAQRTRSIPIFLIQQISNFDTYNSLTPNWYYKVLR